MTKTRHCEDCRNFAYDVEDREITGLCAQGHLPRFYAPRDPMDQTFGWKRKCDDFSALAPKPQEVEL